MTKMVCVEAALYRVRRRPSPIAMNTSTSSNRDHSRTYRDDARRFFSRYPVVLFILLFSGMFTVFSVMDALGSAADNPVSYSHHVGVVALRAGAVSIAYFLFQLWRWR